MTVEYDLVVLHIKTQNAFVVIQEKGIYGGDVIIKEPLTNLSQEFDYGDHRFKVVGFHTLHNGNVEIYCDDVNRPESYLRCLNCGGNIEIDICMGCLREEPYNGYSSGKKIYEEDEYVWIGMIYVNSANETKLFKGYVCTIDVEDDVKKDIQESLENIDEATSVEMKEWWWSVSFLNKPYTGVNRWSLLPDWIIEHLAEKMGLDNED